jgi:hypothetical protein
MSRFSLTKSIACRLRKNRGCNPLLSCGFARSRPPLKKTKHAATYWEAPNSHEPLTVLTQVACTDGTHVQLGIDVCGGESKTSSPFPLSLVLRYVSRAPLTSYNRLSLFHHALLITLSGIGDVGQIGRPLLFIDNPDNCAYSA